MAKVEKNGAWNGKTRLILTVAGALMAIAVVWGDTRARLMRVEQDIVETKAMVKMLAQREHPVLKSLDGTLQKIGEDLDAVKLTVVELTHDVAHLDGRVNDIDRKRGK